MPPVVVILKYVSDSEIGTSKETEENCDEVYFGEDIEVHQIYVWLILAILVCKGVYSVYIIKNRSLWRCRV